MVPNPTGTQLIPKDTQIVFRLTGSRLQTRDTQTVSNPSGFQLRTRDTNMVSNPTGTQLLIALFTLDVILGIPFLTPPTWHRVVRVNTWVTWVLAACILYAQRELNIIKN